MPPFVEITTTAPRRRSRGPASLLHDARRSTSTRLPRPPAHHPASAPCSTSPPLAPRARLERACSEALVPRPGRRSQRYERQRGRGAARSARGSRADAAPDPLRARTPLPQGRPRAAPPPPARGQRAARPPPRRLPLARAAAGHRGDDGWQVPRPPRSPSSAIACATPSSRLPATGAALHLAPGRATTRRRSRGRSRASSGVERRVERLDAREDLVRDGLLLVARRLRGLRPSGSRRRSAPCTFGNWPRLPVAHVRGAVDRRPARPARRTPARAGRCRAGAARTSSPVRERPPSQYMTIAPPRSRIPFGGDERLLVLVAAPHREHAAVGVDPLHRRLEQLRLGHEAHAPADERAGEEVVHEREVVRARGSPARSPAPSPRRCRARGRTSRRRARSRSARPRRPSRARACATRSWKRSKYSSGRGSL